MEPSYDRPLNSFSVGGPTTFNTIDNDLQLLCQDIKKDVEENTNRHFTKFEPISYSKQKVGVGEIDKLKIKVSGEECIHVSVLKHFSGIRSVENVFTNKSENDPLN
ncbi:hypothetical protein ABK040_009729 [Willaertia magna]